MGKSTEGSQTICGKSLWKMSSFQEKFDDLSDDKALYALQYLPQHLAAAGQVQRLTRLLTDLGFMNTKVAKLGPQSLLADYDLVLRPNFSIKKGWRKALGLIRSAIQLSGHVLIDRDEMIGQVLGRLMTQKVPELQLMLERAKRWNARTWFRPILPSLIPPGGPIVRTLRINEPGGGWGKRVAITWDGRRAFVGSLNRIDVWDLETWEKVRSLQANEGLFFPYLVATPDGRWALAFHGNKLTVWDVETGVYKTLRAPGVTAEAVAVTPNGKQAVVAGWYLMVWDLETGSVLHTLDGHHAHVAVLAVTPDGERIITAARDGSLMVWDLQRGRKLNTLVEEKLSLGDQVRQSFGIPVVGNYRQLLTKSHPSTVRCVAVTPDSMKLLTGSDNGSLRMWDLIWGKLLQTITVQTTGTHGRAQRNHRALSAVAVAPDGKRALSASDDRTLHLWDLETGREMRVLKTPAGQITFLAFMPDGRRAVSVSGTEDTIRLWDLESAEEFRPPLTHSQAVVSLAMTPDGRRAVSASVDGSVKVAEVETGRELHLLAGHTQCVERVVVTHDGQRVVSASADGTMRVWDLISGAELRKLRYWPGWIRALRGPDLRLFSDLSLTMDDSRAVFVARDNKVRVWDLTNGAKLCALSQSSEIIEVAVTGDGRKALVGLKEGSVRVWDLEASRILHTLAHDRVSRVAVTPDGTRGVTVSDTIGTNDITIKVWELKTGKLVRTITDRSLSSGEGISTSGVQIICPFEVMITPDCNKALVISKERKMKLWDLHCEKEAQELGTCEIGTRLLAMTPNGHRAIFGSDDTLKIFDLKTGNQLGTFTGDSEFVACTCAPDEVSMVAGDESGGVHIFRLESPNQNV